MNKLSIQIVSVPHKEKLIAEIQYDGYVIAEVSHDIDDVQIELFSYEDLPFVCSLDEFIKVLNEAKIKLLK